MSKIYEKYLKLKLNDKDKVYLFRSGIFYISIGDDATFLHEECGFKLTDFNSNIKKCGFPIKSFNKYKEILDLKNINYIIVKDSDKDNIIKILEKVNINNITPVEALNILERLKSYL